MPKTSLTTVATANTLKTKMVAIGKYPPLLDLDTIYAAGGVLWMIEGVNQTGMFRVSNSGSGSNFTDLFEQNDPEIVLAWSLGELKKWLVQHYAPENYQVVRQGANYTVSFTVAGILDNVEVEALAEAINSFIS